MKGRGYIVGEYETTYRQHLYDEAVYYSATMDSAPERPTLRGWIRLLKKCLPWWYRDEFIWELGLCGVPHPMADESQVMCLVITGKPLRVHVRSDCR